MATTVGVGASMLIAGCAGADPVLEATPLSATTTTTATTKAAPKQVDYTPLLLEGGDIYVPGDSYAAPPPIQNPDGVQGAEELMVNGDQTRAIGITIVVVPDVATATDELVKAQQNLTTVVPSGPAQPVPVGTGATAVTGLSRDGSKAVTALVFSEDRALVRIDFYSVPGQPTPMDFAIDVGLKQAIALRVGLPRLT